MGREYQFDFSGFQKVSLIVSGQLPVIYMNLLAIYFYKSSENRIYFDF